MAFSMGNWGYNPYKWSKLRVQPPTSYNLTKSLGSTPSACRFVLLTRQPVSEKRYPGGQFVHRMNTVPKSVSQRKNGKNGPALILSILHDITALVESMTGS